MTRFVLNTCTAGCRRGRRMLELSGAHSRPSPMPMIGSLGRGRVQTRDAGLSRTEADGHVRQDASCRAAWIIGKDGKTRELRSRFASRLRAPHADVHAMITWAYFVRIQHRPSAARVERGLRRASRKGCGQPRLPQGQRRLGPTSKPPPCFSGRRSLQCRSPCARWTVPRGEAKLSDR